MEWLDQLRGHVRKNTPRNTRPRVNPATVIDEGLLGGKIGQIPQRAAEIQQGLLNVPRDLARLGSPEMSAQLRNVANNGGFDKETGMQLAMDFLQTASPTGGLAGMFIGKGSKVWDSIAAEEAARLLRKDIDPHMTTGTHQGVDDILRQEIPDNLATFHPGAIDKLNNSDYLRMEKLLDHPELYKAYPELRNLEISSARGADSSYYPGDEGDFIQLGRDSSDPLSAMLHEIQHKIQQTEGWAKGGAPGNFKDIPDGPTAMQQYRRLAGEVEARNTQRRMGMSRMDQRREHPYTTMSHDVQDQAVWGVGEELPGVVQKEIVDLYHGGNYIPGQPINQKLYASKSSDFAKSYADAEPGRNLTRFTADIKNPAPESLINDLAAQNKINNEYYTPASVFDHNLHDPDSVDALISALRGKGYDHAVLPDIAFDNTKLGQQPAYVLFPGMKTKGVK